MKTTQQLIEATELFCGKGTVVRACTTGFMMIEMTCEELAMKVANVWVNANKMEISVKGKTVYAF